MTELPRDAILEVLDQRGEFLRGTAHNEHSQFGEDGVLTALLARIGEKNRWCFECGAGDGTRLSNTKRLRDLAWSAVLIECDDKEFDKLAGHARPWVTCIRQKVGGDDLDRLLARCGAPYDLDLGVLDIDGDDWNVWNRMEVYHPRVMMVEYNPGKEDLPPPEEGDERVEKQAGLTAILELGRKKGYIPLARTNVNAIFVAEEAWQQTSAVSSSFP